MFSSTGSTVGSMAPSSTIARTWSPNCFEVGGAQLGAVAVAEVVDLLVAQRLAHHVHVARDRRGAGVGQEPGAHPVDAFLGQLLVELLDVRHPGRAVVDHRFAPEGVEFGVGAAAQRRGRVADASRVEPHQVEVAGDVGVCQVRRHAGDHVDRRAPGPARVDQQRSDPLAGRGNADHRQLGLRPSGIVVVDRDGHGGALRGGNVAGVGRGTWLQLPQFGVTPPLAAPGSASGRHRVPESRRRSAGSAGCQPASNSPNDSSAELNGLRRDMAVNRCTLRIPVVARKGHALISSRAAHELPTRRAWPSFGDVAQHFAPLGGVVPSIRYAVT